MAMVFFVCCRLPPSALPALPIYLGINFDVLFSTFEMSRGYVEVAVSGVGYRSRPGVAAASIIWVELFIQEGSESYRVSYAFAEGTSYGANENQQVYFHAILFEGKRPVKAFHHY